MRHKDRVSIRCFHIESWCEKTGHAVAGVARGSNDVKHVIQVENISTLDYDVQILTNLPDSPPINHGGSATVEFAYRGDNSLPQWTATVRDVGEREKVRDEAAVHCVSTDPGSTRLKSPQVSFRRNEGVQWQTAQPLKSLCITLKIT